MKATRNRVIFLTTVLLFGIYFILSNGNKSPYLIEGVSTKFNKSQLFENVSYKSDSSKSFKKNNININTKKREQRIDGFGAALTESSAYLIKQLPEKKQEALYTDLFTSNGINISMLRVPIGSSDFALESYVLEDQSHNFSLERDLKYKIPVLTNIKGFNPNIKLFASPWSAPKHMKTNNSLNGGSLLNDNIESYTDYLLAFLESYDNLDLDIYALTVQNEPLHATNDYPSMIMNEKTQVQVIDSLGEKLEKANKKVNIVSYDHNWDEISYPINVMNNSKFASGSAFHCYAGDVTQMAEYLDNVENKNVWFTECSGGDWSTSFSNNMEWNLENVFFGMLENNARSVLLWNLALDNNNGPQNGGCKDCRGVITIDENGNYQKNEEYYLLGHFSKYLQPDAYKIELSTYDESLNAIAFQNPDGSIVLVIHNKDSKNTNISIGVDSFLTNNIVEIESNSLTTLHLKPAN